MALFLFTAPLIPAYSADDPYTVKLQVPIGKTKDIKVCEKIGDNLECNGIANLLIDVYGWVITAAAILAVVVLMVGGMRWMTSGGEQAGVTAAKKMISNALIGLTLLMGSYTLLYFINPSLVGFKSLSLGKPVTDSAPLIVQAIAAIQQNGEEGGTGIHGGTGGIQIQGDNNLEVLNQYVSQNNTHGLPGGYCLGWVYRSFLKIYGTTKSNALPWGAGNYPAQVALAYQQQGKFVTGVQGIKNGDVMFAMTPGSSLITKGVDKTLPGYSITHIGIYYNGKMYHEFGSTVLGSPISKTPTTQSNGVLADLPNEVIVGYGQTNLTPSQPSLQPSLITP